ncbi:MAG: hypothetical protein WBG68_12495, partial [Poseidonibacter sp.]
MKIIIKTLFLAVLSALVLSASETITINTVNGKVEVPKNPKRVMVYDFAVLDTIDALEVKDVKIGLPLKNLP